MMALPERPWLGARVRQLREEGAISQQELAERAQVSLSTVSRLEQTSWPVRGSTIRKLARALGVQPQDLARQHRDGAD